MKITVNESDTNNDKYYAIIRDRENTTLAQRYKAAAIYYAPKALKNLPAYISYVENMPLTNRAAAEMGLDIWKFAKKTANAFLTEHSSDYPTFAEFAEYVYSNVKKIYAQVVAKIGAEPNNPLNLGDGRIEYSFHIDPDSLSASLGKLSLKSYQSYSSSSAPIEFYLKNYEKEYGAGLYLEYVKGYTIEIDIDFVPDIDYKMFIINTENPSLSAYMGEGKMLRPMSAKIYCPALGDGRTDKSSCLIGSTPDISKSAIKYNLPVLQEYKAMLNPKKQKATDIYIYEAYDDGGISGIHVYTAYFYVRNAKNWEEADKKVLAYINGYKYDSNVAGDLVHCETLARFGILHGVSVLGDRVISDPFSRRNVVFKDDVFSFDGYHDPGVDDIDSCKDTKRFYNVGGKFYDGKDVSRAQRDLELEKKNLELKVRIEKAYTTAMPDGLFRIDGTGYDGLNKDAKFDYLYEPKTATLTWNGKSPLRFGSKIAAGQKEALESAILQLIGDGKIKLEDDSVYSIYK